MHLQELIKGWNTFLRVACRWTRGSFWDWVQCLHVVSFHYWKYPNKFGLTTQLIIQWLTSSLKKKKIRVCKQVGWSNFLFEIETLRLIPKSNTGVKERTTMQTTPNNHVHLHAEGEACTLISWSVGVVHWDLKRQTKDEYNNDGKFWSGCRSLCCDFNI